MAYNPAYSNMLLDCLPREVMGRLGPALHHVELEQKTVLKPSKKLVEHVYFPTSGITSIVARHRGGQRIEAGLVGREGMVGHSLALTSLPDPDEIIVQVAGSAWRLEAATFEQALKDQTFQSHILKYVHFMMIQLAQTSLAYGKATLDVRLARWLLMCHDRVRGGRFSITHDFLATMLGTRRAGVTVALHELEGDLLIRSTRGLVEILDRAGLEQRAGAFYGEAEAEYEKLFPESLV